MLSNCGAFDSTFECQRDFIYLPIEIWAGCLPQKWPRSARHLLGFASRKTKIPAIPQAPRRHGYKLLVHNTSECVLQGGGPACLEMEESQCRSRPFNSEILCETTCKPGNRDSHQLIHTGGYLSLEQLKPAWQRYIASPKANHLADWAIWSYIGTPSFIGLGCSSSPSVHSTSHQTFKTYEPPHDKTNKLACAPSEDSDQPGYPPSLIRVFTVRMKKAWVLSYPLSAQRRLWSDWADAQADLSLRWAHMQFCWFCHDVAQLCPI